MLSIVEFRIYLNISQIREKIMKIANITSVQRFFGSNQRKKNGFLDNLHTHVKNSADMTDTIVVSRTIFKGYLGIMTGTTLITIGGLVDRVKHPKLFKGTMLAGLLASLYGTWAFVRPFILKDAKGVATK